MPQLLEKKWEYNGTVHQLFIDFEKTFDSLRRKVLYNILTDYGICMKLFSLIKMCLNETSVKSTQVEICIMPTIAFQLCFRICHQETPRNSGRIVGEWNTKAPRLCW
jgi:hypothetical protein